MNGDNFCSGRTGNFKDVSQMVPVGMGDKDDIIRANIFLLRGQRIIQPGVNKDLDPLWGHDSKSRMTIKGDFHGLHLT